MRNLLTLALADASRTSPHGRGSCLEEQACRPVDRRGRQADSRHVTLGEGDSSRSHAPVDRGPTREAGQMGQPGGVGNEGVDPKGSGPKVSPNVFSGRGGDDRSPRSLSQSIVLKLRWESALPVRLAELKSHEVGPPTLDRAMATASPSTAFPAAISRAIPNNWVNL